MENRRIVNVFVLLLRLQKNSCENDKVEIKLHCTKYYFVIICEVHFLSFLNLFKTSRRKLLCYYSFEKKFYKSMPLYFIEAVLEGIYLQSQKI